VAPAEKKKTAKPGIKEEDQKKGGGGGAQGRANARHVV